MFLESVWCEGCIDHSAYHILKWSWKHPETYVYNVITYPKPLETYIMLWVIYEIECFLKLYASHISEEVYRNLARIYRNFFP